MIEFSGRMNAFHLARDFGPKVDVFAFGGTPPTSMETVPFELFLETAPGHPTAEGFRVPHAVNMYNNMLHRCTVDILNENVPTGGYDSITMVFDRTMNAFPKLSFYDHLVRKYRHIPQTIDTDLVQYDYYTGTNRSSSSRDFTYVFMPSGNTSNTLAFRASPVDKNAGFFMEGDFQYEAAIDELVFIGDGSENFNGDMRIFRWDATLNSGAGDWVLHHTHSMANATTIQDVQLPEMLTSRFRIEWDTADSGADTYIKAMHFLGPEPVSNPTTTSPITWAIVLPRQPQVIAFRRNWPEAPVAILTAGGPLDQQEILYSSQICEAGIDNPIVTSRIKFLPKEY